MLYSREMRKRGKDYTSDLIVSAVHVLPQFHRAPLPFASPQPAIAMDQRAWINTQTIPSEMCAHPSLGFSVSSAQGLPVNPMVKGIQLANVPELGHVWNVPFGAQSAGACPATELHVTQASDHSQSWLCSLHGKQGKRSRSTPRSQSLLNPPQFPSSMGICLMSHKQMIRWSKTNLGSYCRATSWFLAHCVLFFCFLQN